MKLNIKKYLVLFFLPLLLIGTSCEEDDSVVPVGNPAVHYIRATNPLKADSLLVGAFMGDLIAIVGNDLGATKELWFNDQKATLNPAYITDKTILVNVPSTVPSEVTNKMRFVFSDGSELTHDFSVNVPGPIITGVKSEYVPDGGTLVLEGDFFFEPKVIFPDDLEGTVTLVEKTKIEVTVPDGATTGQIAVKTNFGTTKSSFIFRDDRNIILNFDDKVHESWTAPIAYASDNPTPAPVSGNYAFFKHDADGAWMWVNELTMQYWAPRGKGNVPVATGIPSDLVFKFEVNVPIEWRDVRMEIILTSYVESDGRSDPRAVHARWKPWKNGPFKTEGWETVSIPLTEFKYGPDDGDSDEVGTRKIEDLSKLTNVVMMLFGPADGANPVHIAFDNIRIVPK